MSQRPSGQSRNASPQCYTFTAPQWNVLPPLLKSDFDLTRYNIEHAELLRLCTEEYEQRGFTVCVERQNDFRLQVAGATISGRHDIVA